MTGHRCRIWPLPLALLCTGRPAPLHVPPGKPFTLLEEDSRVKGEEATGLAFASSVLCTRNPAALLVSHHTVGVCFSRVMEEDVAGLASASSVLCTRIPAPLLVSRCTVGVRFSRVKEEEVAGWRGSTGLNPDAYGSGFYTDLRE